MARSTYIYLIMSGSTPVAAFTVKHEMITWLARHPGDYEAWSLRDGINAGKPPTRIAIPGPVVHADESERSSMSTGIGETAESLSGPSAQDVYLACVSPNLLVYDLTTLVEAYGYALTITSSDSWANERQVTVSRDDGTETVIYHVEMVMGKLALDPLDGAIRILRDIGMIEED